MTKQVNSRMLLLAVLFLSIALIGVGCSSKNSLETTPGDTATQIAIAASPTTVETNQTSVVEATVSTGGTGEIGQVIEFSVTPSSAGTVTPQYDTTGADGVAATIFTASQVGAVVVQAQVVGTAITSTIGLSVTDTGIQGGSGNINITATRSLLLANGHDTSQVTVVVTDDLGQPAADGTLLKITAGEKFIDVDGNGYWSANVDSLVYDVNNNGQWDSFGLIPSTATLSGGNGQVSVNYISGDEANTVYVKVTVDDGNIQGDAELSLQISPNTVLHSIYLASDSLSLSVQATGGIETSHLRAIGYDINGNPVPEGMAIVFAILDGPGGGEQLDTLAYGPDTAYTNGQGVALTSISSGTISGTVRVRAYAGTVLSNAAQLLIAAGPPEYIVIGSEFCNAPYWNTVAEEVGIVAVVSDVYLNPVNDSTIVYFSTDEGTMMSHQARTTGGQGIATSTWFSGNNVPTADGVVQVNAETSGGTVSGTSFFYNTHIAANLAVSGWQPTILADGEQSFTAVISATDLNGLYVVGGTTYEAEASYLTVSGGAFQNGCESASDRTKVVSSTLTSDGSITGANDDGIGAVDQVTYWAEGGASITLTCTMLTGTAYNGSSQLSGPTTAQPGEQVNISAVIADRWANPLGDHTLQMTANDGVVTGGTQETNAYGEASGFVWTAPALDGDYNITVTDQDPRGGGLVLTIKVTVKAAT